MADAADELSMIDAHEAHGWYEVDGRMLHVRLKQSLDELLADGYARGAAFEYVIERQREVYALKNAIKERNTRIMARVFDATLKAGK